MCEEVLHSKWVDFFPKGSIFHALAEEKTLQENDETTTLRTDGTKPSPPPHWWFLDPIRDTPRAGTNG